jgi:hypothetical protein
MDQVGEYLNRPRAYGNVEGVWELGVGFLCLVFGLFDGLLAHTRMVDAGWKRMGVQVVLLFLILPVTLIVNLGISAIKKRITYPRTGFVEVRRSATGEFWTMLFWIAAGLGIMNAGASLHGDVLTPALLLGLLTAASYAYTFARPARWKWTVALAMSLGTLAVTVLPAPLVSDLGSRSCWWRPVMAPRPAGLMMITILVFGGLLLVSGGISLWLYLRRTQAPSREAA